MLKPQFKVETVKKKKDYGEFVLKPLEQGYGDTLGNALRRCLLSSIKGAAITEVKIAGVRHQFSTMAGLKEDVVELILNIKKLRVKYGGKKEATLKLQASGPKEIKAKDVECGPEVEILNKDLVIANLADKKSKLSITMKAESGMGYSPAEERKSSQIGAIPIDANFSPVIRVSYKVATTRVGRRTDFDKLIFKVWTDGTISAKEALEKGAKILVRFFKQIYKPTFEPKKPKEQTLTFKDRGALDLTVEELDLPTRIANALRKGGYKTVEDLAKAEKEAITKVKNLGKKSVEIIEERLKEKKVSFKE